MQEFFTIYKASTKVILFELNCNLKFSIQHIIKNATSLNTFDYFTLESGPNNCYIVLDM